MKNLFEKNFTKNDGKVLLYLIILASFINLTVECFSRASLLGGLAHMVTRPQIFLYNALVIFMTLSIAFLTKRRIFTTALISIIWIGFGVTNFVILSNRVTPFNAIDFSMIGDAFSIMNKYFNVLQVILVVIAAIIVIALLIFAWIRAPKHNKPIPYLRNLLAVATISLSVFILTQVALATNVLASSFGNLADAYKDYGFVYCFASSLVNTGMDKPKDYSPEVMSEIAEDTLAKKKDKDSAKKPNVVMIQLESFFDPTTLAGVKFSEDPIPNVHKLSKEFSSGTVTVPSIGAGTANTEFEVITGMNLDFFGPGEYPYKTILKETTAESTAYNLKELGYGTHAIHNNDGCFYGRNKVFANLGFDTFTSLEYMNPIEVNPTGWAKDEMLIKEIFNALNSTPDKQDFVYTISVQGHGKYPNNPAGELQSTDVNASDEATKEATKENENIVASKEDEKKRLLAEYASSSDYIKVDGFDEEKDYAFEYYVNQIHEMDAFIGKLVDELSKYDEEVVLVLFGDHLPTFGLVQEDLAVNTLYDTPYVIWDNIGLEKKDKNMQSYELSSYVLGQLNIDNGTLIKFHQEESHDSIDYLSKFELLQYDMLYGKKEIYGEVNPYKPTDIKMGFFDAKLNKIIEEEDRILVEGEYFTEYSRVIINDDIIDTTYISDKLISIEKTELHEGDVITVGQVDGDFVLSATNEYIYRDTKSSK